MAAFLGFINAWNCCEQDACYDCEYDSKVLQDPLYSPEIRDVVQVQCASDLQFQSDEPQARLVGKIDDLQIGSVGTRSGRKGNDS
ncbi:hypothetical protein [Paenibacillus polymyxa]|uniref:hypothetical protein n=1 Tax=Paenibacillus polymyxa TaxID=1406 RepID=UPI0004D74BF3|nr:hypothetical protein [Paenibacillus polymyxa]KEO78398.1 hypothetical protein EL23_12725 [Paenibacillus polymyxa]